VFSMSRSLSIGAVLRRTFSIYAAQAPMLLTAALLAAGVIAFDRARPESPIVLVIAALLIDLLALGLFICVVVLVAADVWDGGARRDTGELLRDAWSALGGLLLVGFVAGVAITFVTSIGSTIVLVVIVGILFGSGVGVAAVIFGVLLVPVLVLFPELFLLTVWSVVVAVAVLERPGGLRALGRSRELVRGNGWRVLALILALAVPLTVIVSVVDRAAHATGGGTGIALRLLLSTVLAPIPLLAATALYFELRRAEPTPTPIDPAPSGALSPGVELPEAV
jgi:hypothetical protein